MGGSQRPGRDGLLTLQSQMRPEGKTVSIAQLCQWFGLARSSFYYAPQRRGPVLLDAAVTTMARAIIEANPIYGLRRITAMLRREVAARVNRKKVHRIIRHNGCRSGRSRRESGRG
jgi:putative transposase